jgi:hypothetical protein
LFEVAVTNPVAGLTTVAVAPFFNLSAERTVDGRRFAEAYFVELQKTPGFQVLPVGVTEQALHDHQLELNSPDDALRLAKILNVDAVVVGAVTDYSPYYPPRIGLQVSWYSPKPWTFWPGVPTDPLARDAIAPGIFSLKKRQRLRTNEYHECSHPDCRHPDGSHSDCQNPHCQHPNCHSSSSQTTPHGRTIGAALLQRSGPASLTLAPQSIVRGQSPGPSDQFKNTATEEELSWWDRPLSWPWSGRSGMSSEWSGILPASASETAEWDAMSAPVQHPFNPRVPLMSYTRMFDGADPRLTARLRDYFDLGGDLRSGGWEGYLQRSDDFIRFTAHLMVVEMMQLHGGEAKRRVVFKRRKHP